MHPDLLSNPEIYVKFALEPSVCLSVDLTITVGEFKDLLHEIFDLEPENQKIVFQGRPLKEDGQQLKDAGITPNETVYLLAMDEEKYREKQRNALEHTANIPVSQLSTEMGKQGASAGGPSSMLFDSATGNGALMKQMMRSPIVQDLLKNPEVMESMLLSDPRIKKMIEKNPEMRKNLTNPETMKEMIEMMTNPDYQKHVQKSVDRALINLNAMPGGFDALKQVYSMQKPLFEEQIELGAPQLHSQQPSTTAPNRLFASESLPNPWESKQQQPAKRNDKMYAQTSNVIKSDSAITKGFVAPTVGDDILSTDLNIQNASETYKEQLKQLEEFGFLNKEKNLQALIRAKGCIDDAIDILIDQMEVE